MRIGIECGGTFTDLVVVDEQGGIVATDKVFSTPDDPSRAVITALEALSDENATFRVNRCREVTLHWARLPVRGCWSCSPSIVPARGSRREGRIPVPPVPVWDGWVSQFLAAPRAVLQEIGTGGTASNSFNL